MRLFGWAKYISLAALSVFGSMCDGSAVSMPEAQVGSANTCGGSRGFDASRAVRIGECGPGELLISGTIVRDVGDRFQHDGLIELGADSAAIVTLLGSYGDIRGDAPGEGFATQIIAPVDSIPISYCISGDLAKAMGYRQLLLHAEVRQHADTYTAGDLFEEYFHEVTVPTPAEPIHVTGMEECGTANSGGFCLCGG